MTTGERGVVPGLAAQGVDAGPLDVGLGARVDERDLAGLALDQEPIAGQDRLAVAVATALPAALARGHVDAGEAAVVEAVEVAVPVHDVRELGLERDRL